jgi:hypothetical protein
MVCRDFNGYGGCFDDPFLGLLEKREFNIFLGPVVIMACGLFSQRESVARWKRENPEKTSTYYRKLKKERENQENPVIE